MLICRIENCQEKARSKGLCKKHYNHYYYKRKKNKKSYCSNCKKLKKIHAKNLCSKCYMEFRENNPDQIDKRKNIIINKDIKFKGIDKFIDLFLEDRGNGGWELRAKGSGYTTAKSAVDPHDYDPDDGDLSYLDDWLIEDYPELADLIKKNNK